MNELGDIVWIPVRWENNVLPSVIGRTMSTGVNTPSGRRKLWVPSLYGFPGNGYGWFFRTELRLYCPKDDLYD